MLSFCCIRPLSVVCAVLLPLAYVIGLVYSLKTHKHIHVIPEADVKSRKGGKSTLFCTDYVAVELIL